MRKKQKPSGRGKYATCFTCEGYGNVVTIKKAQNAKHSGIKELLAGHKCTKCKGTGWVDAER